MIAEIAAHDVAEIKQELDVRVGRDHRLCASRRCRLAALEFADDTLDRIARRRWIKVKLKTMTHKSSGSTYRSA
jgi:hypothetical protein